MLGVAIELPKPGAHSSFARTAVRICGFILQPHLLKMAESVIVVHASNAAFGRKLTEARPTEPGSRAIIVLSGPM